MSVDVRLLVVPFDPAAELAAFAAAHQEAGGIASFQDAITPGRNARFYRAVQP